MKVFRVFICFLYFLFIIGCNRSIYYKLYGKWIADDELGAVTMLFNKDGKIIVKYKEGVELNGSWVIDSNNNIQINMDIWDIQAEIEEDKLILKNKNNKKFYRKIK